MRRSPALCSLFTLVSLCALHPALAVAQDAPRPDAPRLGATLDFLADFSDRRPLGPDSARFAIRGVELSATGAIARGWAAAIHGFVREGTGAELLEGYAARRFGRGPQIAIGRTLIAGPVGNTTHLHSLVTIERSIGERLLLDPDGVAGNGVTVGAGTTVLGLRLAADAGMYERFLEDSAALRPLERPNRLLSGLGYAGRVVAGARAGGLLVAATGFGMTSRREQPLSASTPYQGTRINAVVARQSVVGGGLAMRRGGTPAHAPNARAATSWIDRWLSADDDATWMVAAQVMRQLNEDAEDVAPRIPADAQVGGPSYLGPVDDFDAVAVVARMRPWRSLDATLRYDMVQDPLNAGEEASGVGGSLGWRWGAQGRVAAAAESVLRPGSERTWRVLVNAVFTLGTHGDLP